MCVMLIVFVKYQQRSASDNKTISFFFPDSVAVVDTDTDADMLKQN